MIEFGSDRLKHLALWWVGPVLALAMVFAISLIFSFVDDTSSFRTNIVWPERLSASSSGRLVVVATDDGEKVEGAKVELFQLSGSGTGYRSNRELAGEIIEERGLRLLSSGLTDAHGHAILELPPVGGAGTIERVEKGQIELVVRVRGGGLRVVKRGYDAPTEARLVMVTDRPLYQPGQRVHMKVLGVESDSGRPIQGVVKWRVRDPRGNLVLEEDGQLSAAGVASMELALARQCVQGLYQLSVTRAGVSASKQVEVRPFRLPRYKVGVSLDSTAVKPGGALAGKVSAQFTYGDPVKRAETEMVILFTRVNNRTGEGKISGKTDDKGVFAFSWDVPRDIKVGAKVKVQALVKSPAGRVERGKTSASVGGPAHRVELLAAGAQGWKRGVMNTGFVIVTKGTGQPVSGASLKLKLPERKEEREVTVVTDSNGHARFQWIPPDNRVKVRMELTPPEGEVQLSDRWLSVGYGGTSIWVGSPSIAVGEALTVKMENFSGRGTLVAFNRGYPVAASPVKAGSKEVAISLGPEARGMTTLRLMGSTGSSVAAVPVWVVQRGGDAVVVKADAETYAPGSEASLDLEFPAFVGEAPASPPAVPVTFGLVGVDEALYALKERVGQPLSVLLRQDPDDVRAVADALGTLDRLEGSTELAAKIAAVRFSQLVGAPRHNTTYGQDLTRSILEVERRPYVSAWLVFLLLLVLGLAALASRVVYRALSREAFGWGRAAALVGICFAGLVVSSIFGAASSEALVGGGLVWCGVVACWTLAVASRAPELKLSTWLWSVMVMSALTGAMALAGSETAPPQWLAYVLVAALGLVSLFVAVELGLWTFVLHQKTHRKAAFGLVTLVGLVMGMTLASMTLGGADYHVLESTMSKSAPMSEAPGVMDGGGAGADEDDLAKEESPREAKPNASGGARVRSFFPETMVWIPELASDAEGRAKVKMDVPDSITTWRLDATASSWDGRFGDASVPLRVYKGFFLELDLPTHLTVDDRVEVPITLVNNETSALVVDLSAKGDEGLVVDGSPGRMSVPAGQRRLVFISVVARRPGSGSVTVSASTSKGKGDAVRRVAEVRPDGRALTSNQSGLIRKGWEAELAVPRSSLEGSVSAKAAVFPSSVSDAEDGLAGMLRGPMGCFEQTSSANYPNVMILRALRQTAPEKWPGGKEKWDAAVLKARKFLALGHQRVISFQLGSGAFSLYNNEYKHSKRLPNVMLTAYGVMQLSEMATVYPVDKGVIRRATDWLVSQQNKGGSWPVYAGRVPGGRHRGSDAAQLRSTAFVAWALMTSPVAASHKAVIERALDHLAAQTAETGASDTLALTIIALAAGGRKDDAERLAGRLAASAERSDDSVRWRVKGETWMGGMGAYADIEATALAAYALLSVEKHPELLQPALRHLSQSRSPWGGWGTTQATLWTLRAFEKLRSIDSEGPVRLSVFLGGLPWSAEVPSAEGAPGQITVEAGDALVHRFSRDPLGGAAKVQIQSSASTAAMAQATALYAVPWANPAARVAGERLKISVSTSSRAIARGAEVEVSAQVRNPTRDVYGASIVELPLPPGAYADPDQFESWVEADLIDTFEVLPTHVRLYVSGFASLGSRDFVYRFRALVRGDFSLPPARAYIFYAPEPVSEIDGGELSVE